MTFEVDIICVTVTEKQPFHFKRAPVNGVSVHYSEYVYVCVCVCKCIYTGGALCCSVCRCGPR